MPNLLTPYSPSLPQAAEPQACSGSVSFFSTYDASSNDFSWAARGPSSYAKSRILRSRQFRDIDEEDGYTTDCEKSPILPAVDVGRPHLEKAEQSLSTQCASKLSEVHIKTPTEDLELLDEPLLTPFMPATKVVKAEEALEDRFGDYTMSGKDTTPSPRAEAGCTPTQKYPLPPNKDQIWYDLAGNEFETAFSEGIAEGMGRSLGLLPAGTFAFGTGSMSAWREEPAAIVQVPTLTPRMPDIPVLHPFEESFEDGSFNSPSLIFDSSVSFGEMLMSPHQLGAPARSSPGVFDLSPNNPHAPFTSPFLAISTLTFGLRRTQPHVGDVLHLVENLDLPALMRLEIAAAMAMQQQQQIMTATRANDRAFAGLGLDIPSPQLPTSTFPSCGSLPSLYSLPSWDYSTLPPTSTPLLPASETMESVAGTFPAAYFDEDAADFIAALYASATWSRTALSDIAEESDGAPALCNSVSMRGVMGLGFLGLEDSRLQSSASIIRLMDGGPDTSVLNKSIVGLGFEGLAESSLQSSSSVSRLVPGGEPPFTSCGDAGSSNVVGLGFGALVECALQSSASVTRLHSPEMPRFCSTLGLSVSASQTDVVGPHCSSTDLAESVMAVGSSGVLSGRDNLTTVSNSGSVSRIAGIEPSGVLPDAQCLEPWHYTPGVENWLLRCSEVGPLAPLDTEIIQLSPPATVVGIEPVNCGQAEIEPIGGLSARTTTIVGTIVGRTVPNACQVRKQSRLRESFVASDLESGELDPRSPISLARPALPRAIDTNAADFGIEEVLRVAPIITAPGPHVPSASEHRGIKPSKSADGLGKGLPTGLASLSTHQREVTHATRTTSQMSTAEECEDVSRLAAASPTSSAGSPNVMVSEERGAMQVFFKIPRWTTRTLDTIPEVVSPPSSTATSPLGRSFSAAWSDLTSHLRSPGKPSGLSRFTAIATTPAPTSPLAGPSGDAVHSDAHNTSALPQPPRLLPRQPHSSWLARLSRGSRSPATPHDDGARSPGLVEHPDAPRNSLAAVLGTADSREAGHKVPLVRRFQMLF